jgi:two-component system, cell cycle sensor histidine kinase and response regulator CckA
MISGDQRSILIVEDDEGVALLERRALERRGFQVRGVTTGAEAIAAVQEGVVDLIVMDYRLPDSTTGLDLLRTLKALGHDPPIIMVTGFSNESTAIEALRQGVRDFVPKTTQYLDYLPDAVERVLKSVRTEQQLLEHVHRLETEMKERRLLEDQLRQAQKMEAIGRLAGGIAHDFNNLLTIIIGYSDVLSQLEDTSVESRNEMLAEIHHAAERAAHLTRQLLAFSRKQILEPRIVNLNDIVSSIEKMLGRLIGEDIAIQTKLLPDLRPISADPGQLEQVIMNLAVNARDAMPQGGEVQIETAHVQLDDTYAQAHPDVTPGDYVMLAVTDSGCGMDEATKARIFEPFFTTKPPGQGTGLGLATVYGIIKQSGGHIHVYSEQGHGTTFKVYFPVVAAPVIKRNLGDTGQIALRGTETILVVEDEANVRILAKNVLEMYGYKVLEADSPAAAIRLSQSYSGSIDVLLTDVVMPQLNGKRLSELLLSDRPQMKVLFMSGYTDDAIVRQGVLDAGVNFIQKPFVPRALTAKVRDVLHKAGAC